MKRVMRMKIEVARQERMSESGRSLLRLIQNEEMPLWDLLVRESVQNSLDAALDGEGFVRVDFLIREFERSRLSRHFEGIRERLDELYPLKTYRLLEIRDSNTCGLTGPIEDSNLRMSDYGNLIKLVYHIGKHQQKEGAGGSWGLGKTVYFRIGIGLVIYYSRIFENGEYASRLAACLVEDEEKQDALLGNTGNHRGIAWWGESTADGHRTIPLTEEGKIKEILDDLGVKPFGGTETGTSVIIPFLRDDLRPEYQEFLENGSVAKAEVPWWNHTDHDYIKIALQRWYAPRLMNGNYRHGRWLKASVNGELLEPENFLPAFRIVQNLYNAILAHDGNEETRAEGLVSPLHVSTVNLRGVFANGSVAGWIGYGRFTAEDLKMTPPHNNLSPWMQIFGRELEGDTNPAIICFTRKPGMIVNYESVGKWVEGISRTPKDQFIIGLFVANSVNRLKDDFKRHGIRELTLEEYIRGCEKADHASWQDWVPNKRNPLIIDKIQNQVSRIIERQFRDEQTDVHPQRHSLLGKVLADALLPPEGFGNLGNVQPAGRDNRQQRIVLSGVNPVLQQISSPVYTQGHVRLDFRLVSGKRSGIMNFKLRAVTESGTIDSETWEQAESGTGLFFPCEIMFFKLESSNGDERHEEAVWIANRGLLRQEGLRIEPISAPLSGKTVGFRIIGNTKTIYKGSLLMHVTDPTIHVSLHVESATEEELAWA